jgi:acetate---CoA ligase (ADP-forming)
VDLLGDARADRYRRCLERVGAGTGVGAMIVILTPQFMTQVEETAVAIGEAAGRLDKPVLACFMGEAHTRQGVRRLTEHNVPNYVAPERAVAALRKMFDQHHWQQAELPTPEEMPGNRDPVRELFQRVRSEGRVQMGDTEARDVLEAYDIPLPPSRLCRKAEEAVRFAEEVGYPVVLKIASPDILHKTDIGGVRLNLDSAEAVEEAFDLLTLRARRYMEDAEVWGCLAQRQVKKGREVIIGMNRDPQFGPLVMFGLGGIYVEALKDVSFRITPFSAREARNMVREIRTFSLLQGVRGETGSDIPSIIDTLLKVSQLVEDFPEIVELDINPLVVFEEGQGAAAIDGRLVLAS